MDPHSHSHSHSHSHPHSHPHSDSPDVEEPHSHSHSHSHSYSHDSNSTDHSQAMIEEQQSLKRIISAYYHYKSHSLHVLNKRKKDFQRLPPSQRSLIQPKFEEKLKNVEDGIENNYKFVRKIVNMETEGEDGFLGVGVTGTDNGNDEMIPNLAGYPKPTEMDMDKVRSTIKLFVRDWAEEGKHERDSTYQPMVEELLKAFSHIPEEQRSSLNVLVPGSGLGRLAFEVVKSGFSCQGNEFAFFMLLASNFILNRTTQTKQYIIYPFIHIFSNILSPAQHQLVPIQIPDVLPSSIPPTSNFSMVAGDFVEVYKDEDSFESFDAILTCFFIDTAKNIVEYLEVIRHVLKPNGVWINLGPLLYHWEGTSEMSIELSWEELKDLISKMGFELKMEKTVSTTYSGNPNSMLKYIYDCIFFTALKK